MRVTGTVTPSCYVPASDILQVFTGAQSEFQSVTFPSWMARYRPNRFAAVIGAGTASGIGTDINDAAKDHTEEVQATLLTIVGCRIRG